MESKDTRTKRQKLRDMANQTESPNEAKIAKEKLDSLGPDPVQYIRVVSVSFKMTQEGFEYFRNWTLSGFGEY